MKRAIFPGSFDPFTIGHYSIVMRGLEIFDEIVIGIGINQTKRNLFSVEERLDMVRRAVSKYPNVTVDSSAGLLAEYAKQYPGAVVVKGLRAASDFEYEFQMNLINKKINPEMETMFLTSSGKYTFLSSSVVREMARYDADLKGFVPDEIIEDIREKAKQWRMN